MPFSGSRDKPPSRVASWPVVGLMYWRINGVGAPPYAVPPGALPQPNPAANSAAAAEPTVGCPLLPHWTRAVPKVPPVMLYDPTTGLRTSENSPSLAKRKEVPQLPRMVVPVRSSTSQLNAILALLVEPVRNGLPR